MYKRNTNFFEWPYNRTPKKVKYVQKNLDLSFEAILKVEIEKIIFWLRREEFSQEREIISNFETIAKSNQEGNSVRYTYKNFFVDFAFDKDQDIHSEIWIVTPKSRYTIVTDILLKKIDDILQEKAKKHKEKLEENL